MIEYNGGLIRGKEEMLQTAERLEELVERCRK